MKTTTSTRFSGFSSRLLILSLSLFAVLTASAQMNHHQSCNSRFRYRPDSIPYNIRFSTFMSGPNTSYSWDFGDGSTAAISNPTHQYAAAGAYNVCLTTTRVDSNGDTLCSQTRCDSIHVMMTPPPPPTPSCNANFSARRRPGNLNAWFIGARNVPGTAYSWDFGDGTTGTGKSTSHAYTGTGTYYVCLTVTLSDSAGTILCTDTACDSVTINTPVPPPSACSARFRYFAMMGDTTVRFNSGSGTGAVSCSWDFGDGSTDTVRNPVHTYAMPGSYNVCLTVTRYDSLGNMACTDIRCDSVNTTANHHGGGCGGSHGHRIGNIAGENSSSPDPSSLRVGSNSSSVSSTVYPNPVKPNSIISFAGFTKDEVTVRIFNSTGKLMVQKEISSSAGFPVGELGLSTGVYFYQVSDGTNKLDGKVIVP